MGINKRYFVRDFETMQRAAQRVGTWPSAPRDISLKRPGVPRAKEFAVRDEFNDGFRRFRALHSSLKDRPIGSTITVREKLKSGGVRVLTYVKNNGRYDLVSRTIEGKS